MSHHRWHGGDRAAIRSLPHKTQAMRQYEYIIRAGEKSKSVCVLLSGFDISHKLTGNGGRQITALHMKGDMIYLQNTILHIADHNVQALDNVQVAYLPVKAVEDLLTHSATLRMAMWRETMVDAAICREWALNMGRRDARTRTAHLLCEIGLRLEAAGLGSQSSYQLPMTQEQLADLLGLTGVHVNRVLMAMRLDGLIELNQKTISVKNWERMVKIGDFDSTYLHMNGSMPDGPVVKAA
ncbi:Crp/Fnr family transcriptional regulator [soil metagenome]